MTVPAVLVAGDSMLDRYWSGSADRLSPEAPVPVLLRRECSSRAGGAANVALNLVCLGCDVTLVTLLGDDAAGHELRTLLEGVRIIAHTVPATAEKIRVVAKRHQLARIDIEPEPPEGSAQAMAELVATQLDRHSWLVLSDYAKGSLGECARMIEAARVAGCRVLVDPKGRDFARYSGAWLLKPNEDEFEAVVGPCNSREETARKAHALRRELFLEHLLETRGERGMLLFSREDQACTSFPAEAREVFDVSGAGDTVIATLACMLARGSDIHEAVRMANKAAGIVVGRFGTSAVTMEDLAL